MKIVTCASVHLTFDKSSQVMHRFSSTFLHVWILPCRVVTNSNLDAIVILLLVVKHYSDSCRPLLHSPPSPPLH